MDAMTVILEARALTKSYGDTPALAGIDLSIQAGEAVAIMGASGSGKTTLLHVLAGIIAPDSGSMLLRSERGEIAIGQLGDRARSALRRETFGFVFQQGLLIPELTALENVALPLMLRGTARRDAEQLAARWLAELGLAGLEQRRIGQLSGGQAQRVAVARAQSIEPLVVFADEPTGALDSATSGEVMDALIASTTGRGRTLVVVTHDEGIAARCGRVVRLRDGGVVESRSRVGEFEYSQVSAPIAPVPAAPGPAAPGPAAPVPAVPVPAAHQGDDR